MNSEYEEQTDPNERRIDMDAIVEKLKADGFAAYVEQTGGGVATIYASRTWEPYTYNTNSGPVQSQRPATHANPHDSDWDLFDLVAGPGWFEPHWADPKAHAFGASGDFYVGPDYGGGGPEEGEDQGVDCADMDTDKIAALMADRLRGLAAKEESK